MAEIQEKLTSTLVRAAERLRETDLPGELAVEMESLARQVDKPCVVAVVGRMNAGKSTFVNALLGQDLAKVGTTETTATINYFTYGNPDDPLRPIRCHWRGGGYTDVDRAFLDGLQGHDPETMRRAAGIKYLEYFVLSEYLKQVTLVDTPGTGAVPDEHQNVTAEFLKLSGQLRDRHDDDAGQLDDPEDELHKQLRKTHAEETDEIGDEADAVIYLVGQIARATDQGLLDEFTQATGGRSDPLNAVGVMSRLEVSPEVMERRHQLSEKIGSQLKSNLNTVIPVGTGVQRYLDGLLEDDRAGLRRLLDALRRIPAELLMEGMLKNDRSFFNRDYDESPVSAAERRALLEALPKDARVWPIFATIARTAADPELEFDIDRVEAALEDISNFDNLKSILKEHFIERRHILRCHGIVRKARGVLNEKLKRGYLREYRKQATKNQPRLSRFLDFIQQAGGDQATAEELESLVRHHVDTGKRLEELEQLHEDLEGDIDALSGELDEYNKDFEALRRLEEHAEEFPSELMEELRRLLGRYGGDIEQRLNLLPGTKADVEHLGGRQQHWKGAMEQAPFGSTRYVVAERAYTRYGIIRKAMLDGLQHEREAASSSKFGRVAGVVGKWTRRNRS